MIERLLLWWRRRRDAARDIPAPLVNPTTYVRVDGVWREV